MTTDAEAKPVTVQDILDRLDHLSTHKPSPLRTAHTDRLLDLLLAWAGYE